MSTAIGTMLQFDTAVHERMLYDSALGRKFDRGYVNQHVEAAKRAVEQIGRSPCAARFRLSPTADVSRCGKLREQRLIYSVTSSGQASRGRDYDAKHLGSLEVDDQIDFCGLLDRQVSPPCVCVPCNSRPDETHLQSWSVARQATGGGKLAQFIDCGYRMGYRLPTKLFASLGEERYAV